MANHQHGRNRSPVGGRSPAGARNPVGGRSPVVRRNPSAVRPPQPLPVSRRQAGSWTASQPGTPGYVEPDVRRWSHPVEAGGASPAPEPALHYIRCALSYQNQLLADIKALLEQLPPRSEEPSSGGGEAQP